MLARSRGDASLDATADAAAPGETAGSAAEPGGETRAGRRRRAERSARPEAPPPAAGPVTSAMSGLRAIRLPAAPPAPTRPAPPPVAEPADGVRHSAPIPPLPGTDGVRFSTPIPPLPGRSPRAGAPLPPIPGRDLPAPEPTPLTRAQRRAAMSPLRRRLVRAAVVLAVLVGLVGSYYVGLYFYVDRAIDRVAALSPVAPEVLAPQLQEGAETYLVVGTGLPGATGAAAVTTLIAHVSSDRQRAVLVTVPPTALVDTPECRDAAGGLRQPTTGSFADALLQGGPSCLVRAVQQLSGLRIDHYLSVDLGRLPGMVDALGGVPVCLAAPLTDADAGLALDAGSSELTGAQVTELLGPGAAGSDVTGADVAQREQLVVTSTLRAALSLGSLANPVTATSFLTRAAEAFTVDDGTSLGDVRALAATLGDLPADTVQRTSVPIARVGYVPAGGSTAQVLLDGAAARTLFDSVISDGVLPAPAAPTDPAAATGEAPAGSTGEDAGTPVEAGTVTLAPADVTVDVLDASGTEGVGSAVAAGLTAQGFRTGVVGVEPGAVGQTLVRFGPSALEAARSVAAAVPGAVLQPSDVVGGAVQLVVADPDVTVGPVVLGAAVPATAAPPAPTADAVPSSCG